MPRNASPSRGGIGLYRDVRLASIWTGTSEVMSMIVAHEWDRECKKARAANLTRDFEADAEEAFAEEEKIYE